MPQQYFLTPAILPHPSNTSSIDVSKLVVVRAVRAIAAPYAFVEMIILRENGKFSYEEVASVIGAHRYCAVVTA
jgi:hypothetical protein